MQFLLQLVVFGGGGSIKSNRIDYVEIATVGNAIHFGDLTDAKSPGAVVHSSTTRGVFISGYREPHTFTYTKTEFITIASKGNGTDFGESNILIRW